MSDTDTVRWLADREHIRALPQRYARAVDQRDFDALSALLHPEGRVNGTRGVALVPDYVAGMRDMPVSFETSMHVLADPLIELAVGADEGTSDCYAVVYQKGSVSGGADMTLGMRYEDKVVRSGDTWVIAERTATMVWMA